MKLWFAYALLAALALCGCAQGGLDSDSIKVSGTMTTAIGVGHGFGGAQSATVGVDF